MVGDTSLTVRNTNLLRRVDHAHLCAFRGSELNGVSIYRNGRDERCRLGVPGRRLRALHISVELRVEVLDSILCARLDNELNAPPDSPVTVCPPELQVLGRGIFVVCRSRTIIGALACGVLVAPHEGLHNLTIQADLSLGRADSGVLKACTRPPGALHILLVNVGSGDFSDLTGQRRLVGGALTNLRPIIKGERKRGVPLEPTINGCDGE